MRASASNKIATAKSIIGVIIEFDFTDFDLDLDLGGAGFFSAIYLQPPGYLTKNVFYISMILHKCFYPEIEDYDHTEGNSIPAENLEIVASDVS